MRAKIGGVHIAARRGPARTVLYLLQNRQAVSASQDNRRKLILRNLSYRWVVCTLSGHSQTDAIPRVAASTGVGEKGKGEPATARYAPARGVAQWRAPTRPAGRFW